MSAAVLIDSFDAPMMDYDGAGLDESWYTAESAMDSTDDAALSLEVDMDAEAPTEYDMHMAADDLAAYTPGPLDVEVLDATEVIELEDATVLAAQPESAAIIVEAAPPAFPSFLLPMPSAIALEPNTEPLPSFALLTPSSELPPQVVTQPLDLQATPPDPTMTTAEGVVEHPIDPTMFDHPSTLSSFETAAPETATVSVVDALAPAAPIEDTPITVAPPDAGSDPHEDESTVLSEQEQAEEADPNLSSLDEEQLTEGEADRGTGDTDHATEPTENLEAVGVTLPALGILDETSVAEDNNDEPVPAVLLSLSASTEPEWCLFNLSVPGNGEDNVDETFDMPLLLRDRAAMFYEPVMHVFEALRLEQVVLALSHAAEGDMMLDAYDIDLTISEDNVYAREVSLYDLTMLHQGCRLPGPLRIRIYFSASRFITRYSQLREHVSRLAIDDVQSANAASLELAVAEEHLGGLAHPEQPVEADPTDPEQPEEETADEPTAKTEHSKDDDEEPEEDLIANSAALAVPEDEDEEEYHQVDGAEATILEDEDDYSDVLALPNDDGTADHSELDAADVHDTLDGETDAPGGDTLPTEYEDDAGYYEDDVERTEDEDLDDSAEVEGLDAVEADVGVVGSEKAEQDAWEDAADATLPTLTPKEMPRFMAHRIARNEGKPKGAQDRDQDDLSAQLTYRDGPPDSTNAYDDEAFRADINSVDAADFDARDDSTSSQEEELQSYDDALREAEETTVKESTSRSSSRTASTNNGFKRGFDEVNSDDENVEDPRSSPATKRARAQ